jgi:LPPG:FO 2-phospho-L-lactate transferase
VALKVVALAGGVGGAKLAHGLALSLPPGNLTVIVNSGDDFELHGLRICPDLDTVLYTLAGVANRKTGWGRADETWRFLETIEELGAPGWFQLGDRDVALHVYRTARLAKGESLSEVTRSVRESFGVPSVVLPVTDDELRTIVLTDDGPLEFQRYFVERRCQPRVTGFRFAGAAESRPAPGVLEAISAAELVVICPSNPWVSIDPILAVPGIRQAVGERPTIAVSPFIRGKAVKGPAAKMAAELGIDPTPEQLAGHYAGLLGGLIYDVADPDVSEALHRGGVQSRRKRTLMRSDRDRKRLAEDVLAFAAEWTPVTAP